MLMVITVYDPTFASISFHLFRMYMTQVRRLARFYKYYLAVRIIGWICIHMVVTVEDDMLVSWFYLISLAIVGGLRSYVHHASQLLGTF